MSRGFHFAVSLIPVSSLFWLIIQMDPLTALSVNLVTSTSSPRCHMTTTTTTSNYMLAFVQQNTVSVFGVKPWAFKLLCLHVCGAPCWIIEYLGFYTFTSGNSGWKGMDLVTIVTPKRSASLSDHCLFGCFFGQKSHFGFCLGRHWSFTSPALHLRFWWMSAPPSGLEYEQFPTDPFRRKYFWHDAEVVEEGKKRLFCHVWTCPERICWYYWH